MDEPLRIKYLQSMGIDVWVPRQHGTPNPAIPANNDTALSWDSLLSNLSNCEICGTARLPCKRDQVLVNTNLTLLILVDSPFLFEANSRDPAAFLLTEIIKTLDIPPINLSFTSAIKCYSPEMQCVSLQELNHCRDYLLKQLELSQPKLILAFGESLAQSLLQTDVALVELRGFAHKVAATYSMLVTYDPRYLIEHPEAKRQTWADLQQARTLYLSGINYAL